MAAENLRQGWISIAARMQQVACTSNTNSVISIHVLVDRSGNPVFWFEPTKSNIEPSARLTDAMADMIRAKGGL